jgi:hypothetical protein
MRTLPVVLHRDAQPAARIAAYGPDHHRGIPVSNFGSWVFAGIGVAVGTAVPTIVTTVLGWLRQAWSWLTTRIEPAERYNSLLGLTSWSVEVVGKRENPDDPVILDARGRGTDLEASIRRTGTIAEPLTREQREAVIAARQDYGPSGSGYWRRHPPEWTRRELILARLFAVGQGTERCMVYGGMVPGGNWVVVCGAPRWHRGAHRWERFS